MSVAAAIRPRLASRWQSFEAWVGSRSSGAALFALALAVFGLQSVLLPVYPGRDMPRYVQAFVQLWYDEPILSSVLSTRGPLTALGVGIPLELGGWAVEVFLGVLYAASIVAWGAVALTFGARAAVVITGLLLVYPGYGILFHELASDALFAAAFAGWAVVVSKAILRPSVATFLIAGLAMGLLVLVRPANQVLIVFALLPFVLRAPWSRRLAWMASFFIASATVTQGWKALAALRYGDAVALEPSNAVLLTAVALLTFLLPAAWSRRVALVGIVLVVGVVAVKSSSGQSPMTYVRSLAQMPPSEVFLFRAFEMDRIVSPDNGPASRELARVVQRDLLGEEPYRSYGIDLDEFFSSGSDRMFVDLQRLGGRADLPSVTDEAIRSHPGTFAAGIARTTWELLWARRVFARLPAADTGEGSPLEEPESIVVDGRRLPRPSEGEPIPGSHVGPPIRTLGGPVRQIWYSPTEHALVFDDPRDERRYVTFESDTNRLVGRIPIRAANQRLAQRWNQASNRFPAPFVWLLLGLVALAVRRPQHAWVALAPSLAGLVVIVATAAITLSVAHYAVPVTPAFIVLAAAGLTGAHPRRRLHVPWVGR